MSLSFKSYLSFLLIIIIFSSTISLNVLSDESIIILDIQDLPFKQELIIPIDTSLNEAKYQPIDIRIKFDNECWAINETIHSVRIAYDDGLELIEIESQIYDLNRIGDNYIDSCGIVFLIPNEVNGNEIYYVFYSDSETSSPEYEKHLSVEDTHYFYEPISGQIIDFDYYQIIEDGYIIYGICQEGELLGNGMSNAVIKLKPNSIEFETVNAEQIASFSMTYSINPIGEDTGSQWAVDVKKSVIVEGNIMVRLRIEGYSPDNELKSDNIYTYYYRPTSTKSLNVNVNHEILKTINIEGDKEREGTYASLSTIKARSATIEKMNIGEILPYIHFYSEDERIKEYSIPIDPNSDPAEWILSSKDDDDLGSKAWMCMDDGETGKTHGLIFESNTGFIDGINDGIQVKSSVHQHVKLPGLEADSGDLFAVRNAYEDNQHNLVIQEDTNLIFNVEFITFQMGGYESIALESELYKILIEDRPIYRGNVSEDKEEEKERYSLTAYLHDAQSFPMGSMLSAALGKNISYITIELYKDNKLASSGSAGKLPIGNLDLDLGDTNLIQKIKLIFNIFDWRNISLFKKLRFPDLDEGKYLIKIYKENPFLREERQYIGFSIVDLNQDTSVHIYCKSQGLAEISIFDSNDIGIKNVRFILKSDDIIISSNISDDNGFVILYAPSYKNNPYTLNVIYDGFLIKSEEIIFGLTNRIKPYRETFSISLYTLNVKVKDKLGLPPAVSINPVLTSNKMVEQNNINAEEIGDGEFIIDRLYPEEYTLKMSYKSFEIEQIIKINNNKNIEIEFPAKFNIHLTCMNSFGGLLGDGKVILDREGKKISEDIKINGLAEINVPPGSYLLSIDLDNNEIAKQNIEIKGDKNVNIITSEKSLLHTILSYIGIIIVLLSIGLIIWKKNINIGLKIFTIGIIILAIVQPWWILYGDNGSISTSTSTYLVPSKIITITITGSIFGGEISQVPEEFTMILELLVLILILSIILIISQIFVKNKFRKINLILLILSSILLFISIFLFYIAMSEVTKVGVGSFTGVGDLSISIPGLQENVIINCSWGFGIGIYLILISLISNIVLNFKKIFKKFLLKILNR
jgi:hypothetical protein